MTAEWFLLPNKSILKERSEPYLVDASKRGDLFEHVRAAGAVIVEVNIDAARSIVDIVGALKGVLEFPVWCGGSWDSIDDAFSELRAAWPLPLAIVVDGLPELMVGSPQLALNTVLGLSRLCDEFSVGGDQVMVFYVSDHWDSWE